MFKKKPRGQASTPVHSNAPDLSEKQSRSESVIGETLTFKGEISADEDLRIEGTVEGTVAHHKHRLTVGQRGRVKADIHARLIVVEGRMRGDLHGDEAVRLTKTADVTGNIFAPRVCIEDGASFHGALTTTRPKAAADTADSLTTGTVREVG